MARRSPLLKLKGDEHLIELVRQGNTGAFDTIVDRYQPRLLGFCRQMIGSTEDAEDVLQEVFVNAYKAMIADNREINLRPWLYRIARNRCLNHLRKPRAEAQESMDMVPMVDAGSTHEKVHNREEFRQLLQDVTKLPVTQRAALLLREIDALSYEEIAQAMDTTVPSVKSLLVRARISLAEASQARMLTCGEVRLDLAEAAEGLTKISGPVRRHVRDCEECAKFRKQLRSDSKSLAMLFPVGPIVAIKALIASKIGLGGAGAGAGAGGATAGGAGAAGAGAAGAGVAGAGTVGATAAGTAGLATAGSAIGASGAASGIGSAVGGAIGIKAVAGVVTAAVITAGAVEVHKRVVVPPVNESHNTPTRIASHKSEKPAPAITDHGITSEPKLEPAAAEPPEEVTPPPADPAEPIVADTDPTETATTDPATETPPTDADTGADGDAATPPKEDLSGTSHPASDSDFEVTVPDDDNTGGVTSNPPVNQGPLDGTSTPKGPSNPTPTPEPDPTPIPPAPPATPPAPTDPAPAPGTSTPPDTTIPIPPK